MEFPISDNVLLGIEHPCIVDNMTKAVESLGGSQRLKDLVDKSDTQSKAALYLRPGDLLGAAIPSEKLRTSDLLLHVTVPKLIRVRKRRKAKENGETQALDQALTSIQATELPQPSAKRLLHALRDNPDRCNFKFVGQIDRTHRFRYLPDFVSSSLEGSFADEFTQKVAPMDYNLLKQITFSNDNSSSRPTEVIPPPSMSSFRIPFNYRYRQNPAVKKVVDNSGKLSLVNESTSRKVYTLRLPCDIEHVPTAPPKDAPKREELEQPLPEIIGEIEKRLKERPIWTRRALINDINRDEWRHLFKFTYQHVCYMFRSGPWRDAVIKLGVDPRTDPKYRVYQTMTFQLEDDTVDPTSSKAPRRVGPRGGARVPFSPPPEGSAPRRTHIFDGSAVALDGRVWQVCDVTEPTLWRVLHPPTLRRECDIRYDGWFPNGTWAKARVLARKMMRDLLSGGARLDLATSGHVVTMPDVLDEASAAASRRPAPGARRGGRNLAAALAASVRGMARPPKVGSGIALSMEVEDDNGDIPIDPRLVDVGMAANPVSADEAGDVIMEEIDDEDDTDDGGESVDELSSDDEQGLSGWNDADVKVEAEADAEAEAESDYSFDE